MDKHALEKVTFSGDCSAVDVEEKKDEGEVAEDGGGRREVL